MDGLCVNSAHDIEDFSSNITTFHHAFNTTCLETLETVLSNTVFKTAQVGDINKNMDILVNFSGNADATLCQRF